MILSISLPSTNSRMITMPISKQLSFIKNKAQLYQFPSFPLSKISVSQKASKRPLAANSQTGPLQKRSSTAANKKKKKKGKHDDLVLRNVEILQDNDGGPDNDSSSSSSSSYHPSPLPKPPAGFVLDEQGRVLMASTKRIATIVDPANHNLLECVIRRVFRSSRGDECMLLCPVDTPIQILKSRNIDGWSAVSDEEVETILPAVAYALAKIHMHLVYSGFCYTARGGFCYSDDDIFDFRTG
ncbi:hypothetical protein CFOL_v3_00416, partial [Cephalotus follicularis]